MMTDPSGNDPNAATASPRALEAVLGKCLASSSTPSREELQARWKARDEEHAVRSREEDRLRRIAVIDSRLESFVDSVGRRYADATSENFVITTPSQATVIEALHSYLDEFKTHAKAGHGLMLYGPSGSGKDHLAVSAAKALIRTGAIVEWCDGQSLFAEMRDRMTRKEPEQKLIQRYTDATVFYVSDPLPQDMDEKITGYQQSVLWRIIDRRARDLRPTWLTINVDSGTELAKRLGVQLATRLMDSAVCLHCNWATFRKPANVVKGK